MQPTCTLSKENKYIIIIIIIIIIILVNAWNVKKNWKMQTRYKLNCLNSLKMLIRHNRENVQKCIKHVSVTNIDILNGTTFLSESNTKISFNMY